MERPRSSRVTGGNDLRKELWLHHEVIDALCVKKAAADERKHAPVPVGGVPGGRWRLVAAVRGMESAAAARGNMATHPPFENFVSQPSPCNWSSCGCNR